MPGGEAHSAGGVCKRSLEPERSARLAHEAHVLALLKGWPLPGLLAFRRRAHRALLVTRAIPGRHPTAGELCPGAAPRRALEAALAALHGQGWVHGDLARANVIWDGTRAWLLDLEHAAPIGAEIATLPARAVRPGLTHPDVIWGRGRMGPWVDHWALARLAAGAG